MAYTSGFLALFDTTDETWLENQPLYQQLEIFLWLPYGLWRLTECKLYWTITLRYQLGLLRTVVRLTARIYNRRRNHGITLPLLILLRTLCPTSLLQISGGVRVQCQSWSPRSDATALAGNNDKKNRSVIHADSYIVLHSILHSVCTIVRLPLSY